MNKTLEIVKKLVLLLVLCTGLIVSGSCQRKVDGSGKVVTQVRDLTNFKQLEVKGSAMEIILSQGPYGFKLEADDNLLSLIETKLDGDRVVVKFSKEIGQHERLRAYVSTPQFNKAVLSGACHIKSGNLLGFDQLAIDVSGASNIDLDINCSKLDIDASGASKIKLMGKANDLHVDMSGAGKLQSFNLTAQNVDIDISGAGNAEVNAIKKLNADISGAGKVIYKGTPQVSHDISGAGSIKAHGSSD